MTPNQGSKQVRTRAGQFAEQAAADRYFSLATSETHPKSNPSNRKNLHFVLSRGNVRRLLPQQTSSASGEAAIKVSVFLENVIGGIAEFRVELRELLFNNSRF